MKILIILGHPARERKTFCEALAERYKTAAEENGHEARLLRLGALTFYPVLHEGFKDNREPEPDILLAQDLIKWAEHLVFVYPLWQFMIPSLLKGFLERVFTNGFAYQMDADRPMAERPLKGRSARLVQTMAMPNFFYRLYARQHGCKSFKSMLKFCGISPVRITYFGMSEAKSEAIRMRALSRVARMGAKGG